MPAKSNTKHSRLRFALFRVFTVRTRSCLKHQWNWFLAHDAILRKWGAGNAKQLPRIMLYCPTSSHRLPSGVKGICSLVPNASPYADGAEQQQPADQPTLERHLQLRHERPISGPVHPKWLRYASGSYVYGGRIRSRSPIATQFLGEWVSKAYLLV